MINNNMSYITLHPLCCGILFYFSRQSLSSVLQQDVHLHNSLQHPAGSGSLSACFQLAVLHTHTQTVTHAHTQNTPLEDRRQSLFVSDWDYTVHQQLRKADVKPVWISVIKRVTIPMLPLTQVENWRCLGIPSFPFLTS